MADPQDRYIDPRRNARVTWTEFLRSQAAVACDFFAGDTATMRHYFVLFFVHVESMQMTFASLTTSGTAA